MGELMNTGDMLLQSILEAPEEDTPRLAYADWLDEQDDPVGHNHAELIRIQIEKVHIPTLEVDLTEFRTALVCAGLVQRKSKIPNGVFTIRHRQRDGSWWEGYGYKAGRIDEFDLERVKVSFVQVKQDKETKLRQKVAVPLVLDLCQACNIPTRFDKPGCYLHITHTHATHLERYGEDALRWTFTRGFVSEISLPLRMYCEADLAAIWNKYPITKVDFPDRVPGGTIGGSAYWSSDDDSGVVRVNAVLPERLHRLTGRYHKTREVSVEKLSQAAVSLGRECARNVKQAVVATE